MKGEEAFFMNPRYGFDFLPVFLTEKMNAVLTFQ